MTWLLRLVPGLGTFLPILGNLWFWIAVGLMLAGAFGYGVHVESKRFAEYRATVAAIGKAQEDNTKRVIARNIKLKKDIDNESKKRIDTIRGLRLRLADELRKAPSGSVVPAPAPGAERPDRVTFDRSDLDRALRTFTAGTAELVGEGAEVTLKLDQAKKWINELER